MFRFIKTKKGFTLVELMIVVVIMAILVAVAVPIYSAVTANAKKKTCYSNQKIIMEQLDTMVLNAQNTDYNTDAEFTITTLSTADGATLKVTKGETVYTEALINGLFQKLPYCPIADKIITVKITERTGAVQGEPMTPNINISCSEHLS